MILKLSYPHWNLLPTDMQVLISARIHLLGKLKYNVALPNIRNSEMFLFSLLTVSNFLQKFHIIYLV